MNKIIVLNGYIERNKDTFIKKIDLIEDILINTKLNLLKKELAYILGKYTDYATLFGISYANEYLNEQTGSKNCISFRDFLEKYCEKIECSVDAVYLKIIDSIIFKFNNKDKALDNIFNKHFENFYYGDNVQMPTDISPFEWLSRKAIWNEYEYLPKNKIVFFNKNIIEHIDEKEIYDIIYSNYEDRLYELAKEIIVSRFIKNNPDMLVTNKSNYFKSDIFQLELDKKIEDLRKIITK